MDENITDTKLQREKKLISYFESLPAQNRKERRRASKAFKMPMVAGTQKPKTGSK